MGLGGFFKKIFSGGEEAKDDPWGRSEAAPGASPEPVAPTSAKAALTVQDLASRLGTTLDELRAIRANYATLKLPKKGGGVRIIDAPEASLKAAQRKLLKRVFRRLKCHAAAHGFERGRSIVTNARAHAGREVVLRLDLKDFFHTTASERVAGYFRRIGWDKESTKLLVALTTLKGGLPQGAPTSPRLSNLVNVRLDARLAGLAAKLGAKYSRYADDITFSFATPEHSVVQTALGSAKVILHEEGYAVHLKKKLTIRRRHQQQRVTGLVVNAAVNLPRSTRRRLRAVEHHLATGKPATLTPAQLAGWRSLESMVARQRAVPPA